MAANNDVSKNEGAEPKGDEQVVQVPLKVLTQMQDQMAEMERKQADIEARNAGLEELFAQGASTEAGPKIREKKTFEPKFRTVRLRKYPMGGDFEKLGWVIGWTNRGAYQEVDRSGVSPQVVDMIDVIFLGDEKTKDGKIKAEKIRLLDLMNKGVQEHCKILDRKVEKRSEPTGEEIDVSIYDPAHGLTSTGEKIDGYVAYTDTVYQLQVPGMPEPVWVDEVYCNS